MHNFKAVIFDLDGTLANTMPDLKTSMNEMLAANGFPLRSETDLLGAINFGAKQFVRLSLPEEYRGDEAFVTARHAEYTLCYDKHYAESTALYPGMAEAVAALKAAGMRMAVLSNKQDGHTKALIAKLFPRGEFDVVLGQTALPTKPDPTSAFYIAGSFDLRPSEIAFVGDSHIDMKTALNAGMYPIGVSWGYRPPDFLVENGAGAIIKTASELIGLICPQLL